MPIRLSGMNSGLDTESIIAELVKAKSVKKDNLKKAQTKLSWKQEAWKDLNAKVYGLYSKTLSNMRLTGDYYKKTTKVSNDKAATVITGGNAVNGVQSLEIKSLAASGYLTGGKLEDVTGSTRLSKLEGIEAGSKISLTTGDKTTEITVDENMTVSDLVKQLQEAGVNANFDEKNQRFFISAKETGKEADFKLEADDDVLKALGLSTDASVPEEKRATRIMGEDAKIILNGSTFTSKDNTFEINGLTITANEVTTGPITLTTANDTDGIYDMIKGFLKEYNEIINEMDKLYSAEPAKGYNPLTDEEKDAMSEDEVKKWESKIKDSILRRDSTLGTVASAMKQIMMGGVEMSDGKKLYLSEFGIGTLGYLNAPENEKNAYHIDGDPDDTNTASNSDRLKTAIANDPDRVIEFFSQLSKSLYNKLGDMMKSTEYSSAFTLYDDKSMKEEYNDYNEKISRQEKLITNYEDRYYKKFTAMETALAKLQSKESALSGLFSS